MTSPVRGMDFFEELFEAIDLKEEKEDLSIFSDSGYTKPTHNFSPGQMIYIRVESLVSGDREKTLRLLDSEKKEVQRLNLNQNGNIFTASFAAPNVPGVYYIDIKIEDSSGSKFASQENINVGGEKATSVISEAESEVIVDGKITPEVSPQAEVESFEVEAKQSLVERIVNFFRNLFSFLKRKAGLDKTAKISYF